MAKWWKDRDKWMPREPRNDPPRHDEDSEEDQDMPGEDIGDVADDADVFDDVEPPDRGLDI